MNGEQRLQEENIQMASYVRIIDIPALLLLALKRWRLILLIGALFAAASLGGSVLRQRDSSRNQQETHHEEQEPASSDIDIMDQSIENKKLYLQNSVLPRLDPNAVSRAYVRFTVRTESMESGHPGEEVGIASDRTGAEEMPEGEETGADHVISLENADALNILLQYISRINHGIRLQDAASELGMEETYLYELVSAGVENEAAVSGSIKCIFNDERGAEILARSVTAQLEAQKQEIASSSGEHTLTIEKPVIRTEADRTYSGYMKERLQEINDLRTQEDNYQKNFGITRNGAEELAVISFSWKREIGKAAVFGVIGLLVGFLAACGHLIARGRFISSRESAELQSVEKLAVIPWDQKGKGPDHLLYRLGKHRFSHEVRDVCFEIASENIRTKLAPGGRTVNLALVTDIEEHAAEELRKGLQGCLEKDGVEVRLLRNLNGTPQALQELSHCDAAVVAMQTGVTRNCDLYDEIHTIRSYNKDLHGGIILC